MTHHPDNHQPIVGITLPHWEAILEICRQSTRAISLGYMGIDICIDREKGPQILEINGRPGLEIQNVNGATLLAAQQQAQDPVQINMGY